MFLRWLWCPLGNCCCKASPWHSEEESPCKLCHLQQKLPWMEEDTPALLLSSSLCTQAVQTHLPSVGSCGLKGLLQQAGGLVTLLWNRVDTGEFFYQLCHGYKSEIKPDDGFISRHPLPIHLHIFFIPSNVKLSEGDKYQQVAWWHTWTCCISLKLMRQFVLDAHASPLPPGSLCPHFYQVAIKGVLLLVWFNTAVKEYTLNSS